MQGLPDPGCSYAKLWQFLGASFLGGEAAAPEFLRLLGLQPAAVRASLRATLHPGQVAEYKYIKYANTFLAPQVAAAAGVEGLQLEEREDAGGLMDGTGGEQFRCSSDAVLGEPLKESSQKNVPKCFVFLCKILYCGHLAEY